MPILPGVITGILFASGWCPTRRPNWASTGDAAKFELVPLEVFAANPAYEDIKVSPTGEYLAATFFNPEDVTESKLVVLDIQNMKVTAIAHVRGRDFISNFFWANDERIVGQIARKVGWQDQPFPTGDMVSMNWNGKRKRWIFGQRKQKMAPPS